MQTTLMKIDDKKAELMKLGYRDREVVSFIYEASNGKAGFLGRTQSFDKM